MNILTFDIEDWYHLLDLETTRNVSAWSSRESRVEKSTEMLLELLDRRKQRATFFVLGWIARKNPSIVRRISDSGFEVASHSDQHQLIYQQSQMQFISDLDRSIKSIEDITGKSVRSYRAPGFSLTCKTPWVFDSLIERGIEIDCSIFPASRAHGGFQHFGAARPVLVQRGKNVIKEFPINTARILGMRFVFSGGGYFRLLPYKLIQRMFASAPYVMTYFHPRDFDSGQPILDGLSPLRRFKSYVGIKGALTKLDRLLCEVKFLDLEQANRQVDWTSAERIIV